MNILLVSQWNHHSCCQTLTWNQHFKLFRPEIDVFELLRYMIWALSWLLSEINTLTFRSQREINILSYLDLKSAFLSLCAAWEMNILLASKWNQHSCCSALTQNQQFKLLRPEIDILELTPCEINMLLVSKWNEHPCRYVLMWNQQFMHFWLEINKI